MGFFKDMWNKLTNSEKENVADLVERGADIRAAIFSERVWGIAERILGGIFLIGLVTAIISFLPKNCSNNEYDCEYHNSKEYLTFYFGLEYNNLEFYCEKCKHRHQLSSNDYSYTREELVEPTCQSTGEVYIKCKMRGISGYVIDEVFELPKVKCQLGDEYSEEIPSTCITHGTAASGLCKWCSTPLGGEELPLGPCTNETIEYIEPTCLEEGSTGRQQCIHCLKITGEPKPISKIQCSYSPSYVQEQSYSDQNALVGSCIWCSSRNVIEVYSPALAEQYFTFKVDLNKKEASITSLISNEKELRIPGNFNGFPIKTIDTDIFTNNSTIETIIIEEGVEIIGDNAFKNCSSLREVTLPNSLLIIGKGAFSNCKEIRHMKTNNADIKEEAFKGCYNLRTVEQGESGFIGKDAFNDCPKLFFMKFSKVVAAYKNDIFDSTKENTGYIDEYCKFTSGSYELLDDFYYGETFDDIFTYKDGFYYVNYKYDSNKPIVSIDIDSKQIIIPENTKAIYGSAFVSTPEEIESVICPSSLSRIYTCTRIYNNIVFYFKGSNVLETAYDSLSGSKYNEETQTTIEYKCYGYRYSEQNQEGGPYWYYDNEGNVKLHPYPYINYGLYNYGAIGDGITYGFDGQTGEKMENSYSSLINAHFNFKYFYDKSSIDATLARTDNFDSLYNQIYRVPQGTKIITVMLGINDFINNIELGNFDNPQVHTIYWGIEEGLRILKNRFYNPYILFITPLNQFKYNDTNDIGLKLIDIVNAIKKECEKHNVDVLDAYSLCEFNENTDPHSDGIHPTQEFVTNKLAPLIIDYLDKNITLN